jgi:hypothetical protein
MGMVCLICGEPKTIRAHLIPSSFAQEVSSAKGQKQLIVQQSSRRIKKTNTGLYDTDILCASCDGLLGGHEGYVFDYLKKARNYLATPNTLLKVNSIDGDRFVKFGAGLCWKYCVTKSDFGRIDIGPYTNVLANVAFERFPIPPSVDIAMFQLQAGDTEAYFYRAPLPDRVDSLNAVRFSVGGFVFFLKIDRRRNPSAPPPECWLRGRTSGAFVVVEANMFEEWRQYKDIATHSSVRSYFDRMRGAEFRRQ